MKRDRFFHEAVSAIPFVRFQADVERLSLPEFRDVFGDNPPGGVSDIRTKNKYGGFFDRPEVSLYFHADANARAQLLHRPTLFSRTESEADWLLEKGFYKPHYSKKLAYYQMVESVPATSATSQTTQTFDFWDGYWIAVDPETGEVWVYRTSS